MTPAAVEAELRRATTSRSGWTKRSWILAACTAGAASSVCHVSPGGRVSESERFFLRRRFLFFFFQFLNGCEEKWQDFLVYWRHRRLVLQQFSSFLHDLCSHHV